MELLNATKTPAAYTQSIDKSGRESLVVAKGTFTIPQDGFQPILAQQQQPIVEADEFTGEAGFSATLYESDFAPFKPRCDVLLNASAYAPNGRPVARMNVGFSVAKERKRNNFPVWVFRRLSGKALERRNTGRLSSSSNAAGQDAWAIKSGSYFVHVPK